MRVFASKFQTLTFICLIFVVGCAQSEQPRQTPAAKEPATPKPAEEARKKTPPVDAKQADRAKEPVAKTPVAPKPADPAQKKKLMAAANQALRAKDYESARKTLLAYLQLAPNDVTALYNAACMSSLTGHEDDALDLLGKSIDAGFLGFTRIDNDHDLDAIRKTPGFKTLMARRDSLLKADADRKIEKIKKRLGSSYKITRMDAEHAIVASDMPRPRQAIYVIKLWTKVLGKRLFPNKPCQYVTVVLPRRANVRSGAYQPAKKSMVVNLAAGLGSLSHEWTHAMHFADQEALGQSHPMWVVEGLATLYESPVTDSRSYVRGQINFRLPMLMQVWKTNKMPTLSTLFKRRLGAGGFGPLEYAMSRYVMYFLQEKGLLDKWYAEYRKSYSEDPSGVKAIEKVYGKDIATFEKDWTAFTKDAYNKYVAAHSKKTKPAK